MKHWFFAFGVVVFLAWMAGREGWFDDHPDPVQRREEIMLALQVNEELIQLRRQNRDLLIRMEELDSLDWPGSDPDQVRRDAIEWVDTQTRWLEEQVEMLRLELNQAQ
jgi:hypothetical protein